METGRGTGFFSTERERERESINVCCVCDRVQSNEDRLLLLLRLLKAEGSLTKKRSFAAAFSSFHPENVSSVYNVEKREGERASRPSSRDFSRCGKNILSLFFLLVRFFPPSSPFTTVLLPSLKRLRIHRDATSYVNPELMFLRFCLLVVSFGIILIFFSRDIRDDIVGKSGRMLATV